MVLYLTESFCESFAFLIEWCGSNKKKNRNFSVMNDNDTYIVQCNRDNFEDAHYLVQVFCRVLDIDYKKFSIKTCALDGIMKQRLDELGASFWPESQYTAAKTATRQV